MLTVLLYVYIEKFTSDNVHYRMRWLCVGRCEAEDGGAAECGSGGDLVAGADGLDDAQGHEGGRSRLNVCREVQRFSLTLLHLISL